MSLPTSSHIVSFLVQIDLNNDALKEDAFWTSLIDNARSFAKENGNPQWRMVRAPQHGYVGNLWGKFLKTVG